MPSKIFWQKNSSSSALALISRLLLKLKRLVTKPVSFLYCPTRRSPKAYPLTHPFSDRFGPKAARTDYAMSGGSAYITDEIIVNVENEGVWRLGLKTKLRDITDGTSNTFFVGEKAMDSNKKTNGLLLWRSVTHRWKCE